MHNQIAASTFVVISFATGEKRSVARVICKCPAALPSFFLCRSAQMQDQAEAQEARFSPQFNGRTTARPSFWTRSEVLFKKLYVACIHKSINSFAHVRFYAVKRKGLHFARG